MQKSGDERKSEEARRDAVAAVETALPDSGFWLLE
jgi:hypothetical protein